MSETIKSLANTGHEFSEIVVKIGAGMGVIMALALLLGVPASLAEIAVIASNK